MVQMVRNRQHHLWYCGILRVSLLRHSILRDWLHIRTLRLGLYHRTARIPRIVGLRKLWLLWMLRITAEEILQM